MIDQILIIVGATIFGTLGTIHLALTFFSNKFEVFDQTVTKAMKETSPILTKETTMWDAWIGFNASHSFGAILVTAFYVPLAITDMSVIRGSEWFSILPAIIGLSYLALAKKYWFKIPFIGIFIAAACFIGAAVIINT